MNESIGVGNLTGDRLSRLTDYYLMGVAILLLGAGLMRAGLILGITLSGDSFDTLATAQRISAVALVCLDLFAAIGLWIRAAWGPVMWAAAVVVETTMYTAFADLFGSHPLRVTLHWVLVAIYLALALADWRRAARL